MPGRVRRRARRARARLGRINRFLGRIRPPLADSDEDGTPTKSARSSVLSATLCLALAALMVSGKIVEIADRLPLGPERDRWLAAADETDRAGNMLSLNRPYDLLRDLRGAGDDAGQQVNVIGDVEDLLRLDLGEDSGGTGEAVAGESVDDGAGVDTPDGPSATSEPSPTTSAESSEPPSGPGGGPDGQPDGTGQAGQPDGTAAPGQPDGTGQAGQPDGTEQPDQPDEEEQPPYQRPVPVSAEAPLRTLVAGDSQAFYPGQVLRTGRLAGVLEIILDQRHSTGLARPGYFNWPFHLYATAINSDPEIVVMTLGSNDWKGMTDDDGEILHRGSNEWAAEWSRRLSVTLDVLEAPHRRLIWVGLPPTRSDETLRGYALMNRIAAEAVAERDFVTMIDIWDMFGGDDPYREALPPPGDPGGNPVDVRQQDGIHLNRAGARWVVEIIQDEVDRFIADIEPDPTPTPG